MTEDTDDIEGETDATRGASEQRRAMRAAIAEIRREGYKVAVIYGAVDAAVVALAVTLATGVLDVAALDRSVALPAAAARIGLTAVSAGALVALGLGTAAFVVEVAWRVRRPIVERFEAANPPVHEALRTARDAVRADRDTPMARALYADVIDRLGSTSSLGLVRARRLGATVVLIVVLSLASVQVSVAAVEFSPGAVVGGGGGNGAGGVATPGPGGASGKPSDSGGLRSGGDVLGEPEDVTSGSENLSAAVPVGAGTGERGRSYDAGGYEGGTEGIDAQRAGYAAEENVEDAELIRRYNLAIREDEEEESEDE